MRFLLAKDTKKVRTMIFRDVQRTTIESFFRSIGDLRDTDLRESLPSLSVPTLGIYGVNDNIVHPSNADILRQSVTSAQVTMMQNSRHFPMTDEPEAFMDTLNHFLNNNGQAVKRIE
jgi:pimeloyl-ACP methyl ester carboxylesterase